VRTKTGSCHPHPCEGAALQALLKQDEDRGQGGYLIGSSEDESTTNSSGMCRSWQLLHSQCGYSWQTIFVTESARVTILHYNGSGWSSMSSGTSANLFGAMGEFGK